MTVSLELHNRLRDDGLHLIQIKVSDKTLRRRISSEIYVKKNQFNPKAKYGKWISGTIDAGQLNKKLEEKIQSIKNHQDKTKVVNLEAAIKGDSFFNFAKDFIEKYNNKPSQGTYEMYKSKLKKLEEYANSDLSFKQIDVAFLRQYSNHLRTIGNKPNTIAADFKKIRAIFNQAIKEDIIGYESNPFRKIKVKTEKTKKQHLTLEEIEAIRQLPLPEGDFRWDARNIFLFCINLMGMRIGDAMRLKHSNINGNIVLYSMSKTKDAIGVEITNEARKIIDHYNNPYYVFPYIQKWEKEFETIKKKTALVNKGLKEIAKLAGINKKVSTHVSRHTWTALALKTGKNPRLIQKGLGHESFTTTENYINDLDYTDVNELNRSIFD